MEPSEAAGAPRVWRLGIGAAVVVAIVVAAVVIATAVWRGASAPVEVVAEAAAASEAPPSAPPGQAPGEGTAGEVFVHVSGAVSAPGLYALGGGARVMDAIAAAGGLAGDAAPEGVNLAREVSDGEQVVVPTRDELASGPPPAAGAADGAPAGLGAVNLNTADAAQLETLPGVGPAIARRIVDWREANGGFASVDDLLAVSGIGEKVLAGLREQATV